ncbi:MAG: hypothetical protein BAJALOKI1v1_1160013 [Promethearchaeota archaeon]|nr:MAG: hypothetical protein BAJALOKI1v1_1160013 [Candidatus Lokiarchaeota archaeon]
MLSLDEEVEKITRASHDTPLTLLYGENEGGVNPSMWMKQYMVEHNADMDQIIDQKGLTQSYHDYVFGMRELLRNGGNAEYSPSVGGYYTQLIFNGQVHSPTDLLAITMENAKSNLIRLKVMRDSMKGIPEMQPGAEVPLEILPVGTEYKKGDIIVFYQYGMRIVHQVEYVYESSGKKFYVTQRVNEETNSKVDRKPVCEDEIIGKVDLSIEAFMKLSEMAECGRIPSIQAFGMSNEIDTILQSINKLENEIMRIVTIAHQNYPNIPQRFIDTQNNLINDVFSRIKEEPQKPNIKLYLELIYYAEKNFGNSIILDVLEKVEGYLLETEKIRDLEKHPSDYGYTFKIYYEYFRTIADFNGIDFALNELDELDKEHEFI